MSKQPESSCLNCRWAEWVMINHAKPRINVHRFGRCLYPAERMLAAIPASFGRTRRSLNWDIDDRFVIWPNREHTDCPTREAPSARARTRTHGPQRLQPRLPA